MFQGPIQQPVPDHIYEYIYFIFITEFIVLLVLQVKAVTWLADWGSVSGCVVPASLGTDPAGSPPAPDPSDHESLCRRERNQQKIKQALKVFKQKSTQLTV